LNCITIAYLIDYVNVLAATAFFPLIADLALWQSFRDNSSNSIKTGHDQWNRDELYGDKILTVVTLSVMNKVGPAGPTLLGPHGDDLGILEVKRRELVPGRD
jgi:hypothetical protein